MYQVNFEDVENNYNLIDCFNEFIKGLMPKEILDTTRTIASGSDMSAFITRHYSTEEREVVNERGVKPYQETKEPEKPRRKYNNVTFTLSRSANSKFTNSRVYGLKDSFKESPDILMDKGVFKNKYKGFRMPEYNYDLRINSSMRKELNDKLEKNDSKYKKQVDSILSYLESELLEVFSTYGEVEIIDDSKYRPRKLLHIKNTIDFHVILELDKSYKFIKGADDKCLIIPAYKLNVKLREGPPEFKNFKNGKSRLIVSDNIAKEHYFKIELRYLDFVKNKNYFVLCMTPHGYIRLKKEYSKVFFQKITYHYLFKRYFEKYGVSLSHAELESNPQSFFNLVALLKY